MAEMVCRFQASDVPQRKTKSGRQRQTPRKQKANQTYKHVGGEKEEDEREDK